MALVGAPNLPCSQNRFSNARRRLQLPPWDDLRIICWKCLATGNSTGIFSTAGQTWFKYCATPPMEGLRMLEIKTRPSAGSAETGSLNSSEFNNSTTSAEIKQPNCSSLQLGDEIVCNEATGIFRRCKCGSIHFRVAPWTGLHAAELLCRHCKRRGRWLASRYLAVQP
jgi:hypothetical protein